MHSKTTLTPTTTTAAPSLADVIADITADTTLSASQKRAFRGALQKFAALDGRDLGRIPADHDLIDALYRSNDATRAGLAAGTWRFYCANAHAALRRGGIQGGAIRHAKQRSPAWADLHRRLPKTIWLRITPLATHAETLGIDPSAVTEAILPGFERSFRAGGTKNPEKNIRVIIAHWNRAADLEPGIVTRLPPNTVTNHYRLPDSAFPDRFLKHLEAYLSHRSSPAPHDTPANDNSGERS